jgi:GNAT superfamily N-acetyltransferase
MIRPSTPKDTPSLVEIARGTGMFRAIELEALLEVLDDFHALEPGHAHKAYTLSMDDEPVGLVYYAPAAMTDRTWYLWWIIVAKPLQGQGFGASLLRFAEEDVRAQGGRLLLVETSSIALYEPTRAFYLAQRYDQPCMIPDYYADGDGMVVFAKRLAPREGGT